MVWMEFIKVQTARSNVIPMLQNFVRECKKNCRGLLDARVFVHSMVGDSSLCLLWGTDRPEPGGSGVGLQMSNTLKKFGLVDHSVWVEKNMEEEKME